MTPDAGPNNALDSAQAALAQEMAHLGYWERDLETNRHTWSDEIYRILGLPPRSGALTFEQLLERVHPDDRQRVSRAMAGALEAGAPYDLEYRIVRPSGEVRFVHSQGDVNREGSGRARRMLGVVQDITDRKRGEESLALFRSLIDYASDAIEVVDPATGRILDVNERACRTHGYTREEYLALTIADIDPLVARRSWEQARDGLLQAGSRVIESQHRRKDGSVFPVEINLTYIRLQRDYIVAVVRDITARKKLEADLLRAQRLEGLGTLASGIAHDLNNVLAPILMSSQLLQKSGTNHESLKLAQTIERAARRGADVVKQVLAFARGADGEQSVLHPADVIRELIRFLQETFPKSLVITATLQPGLRRVTANPTQLHQVLLNLCLNARDAMPTGGTLEVRAENVEVDPFESRGTPPATPEPYVLIEVHDTGVGISKEVLDRIFDPFFTTKPFGHGTGLGLSMALGIVKSLGGFILVESKPGQGSTFSVYLPASSRQGTTLVAAPPSVAARGRGETILVVDDEQAILDLASCALQRQGYRVLTSTRGNQALALFNQNPAGIKLVITDITMPGMDGWALLRTLRKLAPGLKVAAWSGAQSDPPEGAHPGGNDQAPVDVFIAKPFTVDSLLKTVSELLGGREPAPADSCSA